MDNPLLEPLLGVLRQGGVFKLHELMSRLRTEGWLPQWPLPAEQQLFRTNFLLMNALYQLQARLLSEGIWLEVAPLSLTLAPLLPGLPGVARSDPLREYYLDWQIFWQTEVAEIEELLRAFWQGYCGSLQPAACSPQLGSGRWPSWGWRWGPRRNRYGNVGSGWHCVFTRTGRRGMRPVLLPSIWPGSNCVGFNLP